MSDYVAIRTQCLDKWTAHREVSEVRSDLRPRTDDLGKKSSWAHSRDDHPISAYILERPEMATREIHALALLLMSIGNRRCGHWVDVKIVSLGCASIPPDLILEDREDHPIARYKVTHRSLLLSAEADRIRVINGLFAADAVMGRVFRRLDLARLAANLLAQGHIDESFQESARALAAELPQSSPFPAG